MRWALVTLFGPTAGYHLGPFHLSAGGGVAVTTRLESPQLAVEAGLGTSWFMRSAVVGHLAVTRPLRVRGKVRSRLGLGLHVGSPGLVVSGTDRPGRETGLPMSVRLHATAWTLERGRWRVELLSVSAGLPLATRVQGPALGITPVSAGVRF